MTMTTFSGTFPVFSVFLSFLCSVARGDVLVSCDVGGSCIFPCSFSVGNEEVIHWVKEKPEDAKVFSYYYGKDQLMLQSPQFRDRTLLFWDQISRGNASLKLTEVRVEDAGRYKCYTSTIYGNHESFVDLNVDSPVRNVGTERTEAGFICHSERLYPKPDLSWSTEPPSNVSLQSQQSVQQDADRLYSISSTLTLVNGNCSISCTISTRRNRKKVTMMGPKFIIISGREATISCPSPPPPRTRLLWQFNHSQIVLIQTGDENPEVADQWRPHVAGTNTKELRLQQLTSEQQGTYTCESSNAEETLRSDVHLEMKEGGGVPITEAANPHIIASIVVPLLLVVGAIIGFIVWRRCRRTGPYL